MNSLIFSSPNNHINIYVSDFPTPAVPHCKQSLSSYADDFTVAASHRQQHIAAEALTSSASEIKRWADTKGLIVSTSKSVSTLWTSDPHQSRLDPGVRISNTPLSLDRRPRVLGVTFDTHLIFSPHISAVADRASSRIRLLKALAGTRWGQSKETLLLTYRSYIRPILSYAAPVWFPGASRTAIGQLQVVQNTALRVATGCLKMSPISHLHAETKVLPVSESLDLNCRQYLVSAFALSSSSLRGLRTRRPP